YFGALGAAAATCLSFFLMAVMIYVINQDLFPISYEWTRLARIAGWLLVIYFLSTVGDHTWSWNLGLTVLYPLGLIATGYFKPGEWRVIKNVFGKLFGR
ncbi:MAG: hypothetical protein GXO92_04370, partial [FCB group bacterium]|nr:hypothetical protein [FCB group bacterium]